MEFVNASGTPFRLDVARTVSLMGGKTVNAYFGDNIGGMIFQSRVKCVAYQTINEITNRGEPMTLAKGLVSMWVLGMMNAGPETIVIVPYKPGEESALGPVVKSDYFGAVRRSG